TMQRTYWMELATFEKTLFALEPTRRTVPTTITRMTANITAYSAMSWPSSSLQSLPNRGDIRVPFVCSKFQLWLGNHPRAGTSGPRLLPVTLSLKNNCIVRVGGNLTV